MIFVRLARREPGGAKGLLESMAAGNNEWYRPLRTERKGKVNIVLHRSNGEERSNPRCFRRGATALNSPSAQVLGGRGIKTESRQGRR
jgi:hypothetical protein